MQLLVTEAEYCDFVLHSNIGKPHIQRVYHDKVLQKRIINSTKAFWTQVLIPEHFLMRVPRDVLPLVL